MRTSIPLLTNKGLQVSGTRLFIGISVLAFADQILEEKIIDCRNPPSLPSMQFLTHSISLEILNALYFLKCIHLRFN